MNKYSLDDRIWIMASSLCNNFNIIYININTKCEDFKKYEQKLIKDL